MRARALLAAALNLVTISGLLFVAAGTLAWPAAWLFLAILSGSTAVIEVMLLRHDPELLAERLRPPVQRGQPRWDQVLMAAFVVLFLAWLPLIAVDAVRFGWSDVPTWLRGIGAAAVAACMFISYLSFRVNTFLAPVVRVQADRGQRVISTGPYARVRHPLYSGALLLLVGTPLLLGSWYGLAGSAVLVAILVLRTVLEERTLADGLEGYRGYMRTVRHRLVPGVW